MKKYDYKMEICFNEIELYSKLKERSSEGWRCINVIYNSNKNNYMIIFEKELISE